VYLFQIGEFICLRSGRRIRSGLLWLCVLAMLRGGKYLGLLICCLGRSAGVRLGVNDWGGKRFLGVGMISLMVLIWRWWLLWLGEGWVMRRNYSAAIRTKAEEIVICSGRCRSICWSRY
jgi:hypothetical protein